MPHILDSCIRTKSVLVVFFFFFFQRFFSLQWCEILFVVLCVRAG